MIGSARSGGSLSSESRRDATVLSSHGVSGGGGVGPGARIGGEAAGRGSGVSLLRRIRGSVIAKTGGTEPLRESR